MENPKIQRSQIVFGDIVYWFTIAVAMISIVGPVMAFASMDGNVINPHYLFASIWAGMDPETIWQTAGEVETEVHYLLPNLAAGDGFAHFGLVVGSSVAIPALLAAAMIYAFKERSPGWALSALWIVGLVIISVLGIVSV